MGWSGKCVECPKSKQVHSKAAGECVWRAGGSLGHCVCASVRWCWASTGTFVCVFVALPPSWSPGWRAHGHLLKSGPVFQMLVLPTQPRGGSVMFSFSSSSCTACATTPTASLMCADSFLPLMSCNPMMPAGATAQHAGLHAPLAACALGPSPQQLGPRPRAILLTIRGVAQGVPRDLALAHQPHVARASHIQHGSRAVHGGRVVLTVGQTGLTGGTPRRPLSPRQGSAGVLVAAPGSCFRRPGHMEKLGMPWP